MLIVRFRRGRGGLTEVPPDEGEAYQRRDCSDEEDDGVLFATSIEEEGKRYQAQGQQRSNMSPRHKGRPSSDASISTITREKREKGKKRTKEG